MLVDILDDVLDNHNERHSQEHAGCIEQLATQHDA